MPSYDRDFYSRQKDGSASSASIVVPIILGIVAAQSVCDVGCGVGTWLNAFANCGVSDLLGLDGDYVDRDLLQIPEQKFQPTDLERPIRLERTFDLAISLEVAEHLSPSRAEGFVRDLTQIAPVIVFSAAVPGQGGVNHVNEQWQSWWANLFSRHAFKACDVLRGKIWGEDDVRPWYQQNIVVYARQEVISSNHCLSEANPARLDIIHPVIYMGSMRPKHKTDLAHHLWSAINRDIRKRVPSLRSLTTQAPRVR